MKHLAYQYIMGLLAACLLLTAFTGCTDEANEPADDGRTATIRLDIPMLTAATRAEVPTVEQENAIHQLRVVIFADEAESINQSFKEADLTSGSVTIDNVPVGRVQMYVIANESSIGKNYTELSALEGDINATSKKVHIEDKERKFFPKRGSEFPEDGLPMSWMGNLNVQPPTDTPQTVDVALVRTVAKLNITMNNALTTPITINEMSFGSFFGDCLYLFHETNLDVPDDTEYEGKTYTGLNIEIPGGEAEQLALYIYPSFAWRSGTQSPYTIGFKTTTEYLPQAFVNDYGTLSFIARNTQVNISATLSTDTHVNIDFAVVPWEDNTVDVPSFD